MLTFDFDQEATVCVAVFGLTVHPCATKLVKMNSASIQVRWSGDSQQDGYVSCERAAEVMCTTTKVTVH
jgi:hypothetical protein